MPTLISIDQGVLNFKTQLETAITTGGLEAKEAAIRSSKLINSIHEAVKSSFIEHGIAPSRIAPPLGATAKELRLAGFIKQKDQDVCILPEGYTPKNEILIEGLLNEAMDYYGKDYTERTLVVNIRSQVSSLDKNFDTLFERTIAEAQNLHVRCPKLVMGEVYMIAVPEYDVEAMRVSKIDHSKRAPKVLKYIKSFSHINKRTPTAGNEHKYERVCLLIVDFRPAVPIIHHTTDSLKAAGLIPEDSTFDFSSLSWQGFTSDLLTIYNERFHHGAV